MSEAERQIEQGIDGCDNIIEIARQLGDMDIMQGQGNIFLELGEIERKAEHAKILYSQIIPDRD